MPRLRLVTSSGAMSALVLLLPEQEATPATAESGNVANSGGAPVDDLGARRPGPSTWAPMRAWPVSGAPRRSHCSALRTPTRTPRQGAEQAPAGPTPRSFPPHCTDDHGSSVSGVVGQRGRTGQDPEQPVEIPCDRGHNVEAEPGRSRKRGGVRCDAGSGPCDRASPVEQGARRRAEGLERARSTRRRTTCAPPTVSAASERTLNVSARHEHAEWRNPLVANERRSRPGGGKPSPRICPPPRGARRCRRARRSAPRHGRVDEGRVQCLR